MPQKTQKNKFELKGKTKLNIGCGKDIKPEFVNLDNVKLPGVNLVHDLDKFPWPFEDNSFEYIRAISVLEHLEDITRTIEEIHRISKQNAVIEIIVPHFSSFGAYTDPTHKHFFTYYSFDYFKKDFDYNFYSNARFQIIKRKIIYGKLFFICEWIANLFPKLHEVLLRKFFPVRDLYFKLKVEKNQK